MNKYPVYFQCAECQRFMSYKSVAEGVSWTPFGGPSDLEEPSPEFCHRRCWKRLEERRRDLIRRTSWIGPYSMGHRM